MNTIAAICTPKGIGGIGVIRISGEDSIKIADKIFVPFDGTSCLADLKGYRAKYGRIYSGKDFIDDAVALVFRAPKSYTGEDVVEISCHGGLYLTREILRQILDMGAVLAQPGEFTKRAFLNGKMDLSQAEAVMDLISAKSRKSNLIAYSQREGSVGKKVNKIKNTLIDISAELSVWADYPEEDIPQLDSKMLKNSLLSIKKEISDMIKNYDISAAIKEGVKTAIIGKPNVGKSTFMNLIAGSEKSIVTDVAGTTRDIVEETVMVGDVPLLLCDTAGIRITDDIVEKIGVGKAKSYAQISDLIIALFDSSKDFTEEDQEILKLCDSKNTIIVLNKADLGLKIDKSKFSDFSDKIVLMSASEGMGVDEFKKITEKVVGVSDAEISQESVGNERQLLILKKVQDILDSSVSDLENNITLDAISVLIYDAVNLLMELTGENATDLVINKVFSKFCVGK